MNPNDQPNPTPDSKSRPAPQGDSRKPSPRTPRPPREKPEFKEGKPAPLDRDELPNAGLRLRDLDKSIEAEMEAAMEGVSATDLMGGEPEKRQPRGTDKGPKKATKGTVISIHGNDVFVEIVGNRSQGMIPMLQFESAPPKIGDEIEFDVERYDPANGLIILTRKGAVQHIDWSSVGIGQVVEARVTGTNKGGLSVEVNGIRGFLPISQIDMYRVENVEQYLNQRLKCMITEVEPEERNLVVSRRALLEKEREEQREQFWAQAEEGQTRTGIVRNIKPFGVFVDIGGADGMVPISEMSWARVGSPEDLVSLGQTVQVKITKLDPATRKITLSLKQLAPSPWDRIEDRVHVGTIVKGKVTKLMEFGAFVELEEGLEGLIHISELGTQRVRRVQDVVKEGQEVEVQVLTVDKMSRRIGLSLRAIQEAAIKAQQQASTPDAPATQEPTPEEPASPPVVRRTDLRGGTSGPTNPFGAKS